MSDGPAAVNTSRELLAALVGSWTGTYRLWLEPGGVLRNPTRDDPPIKQRLIRRP